MTTPTTERASNPARSPTGEVAHYVIDGAHSRVGFSVRHMMISNVRGEFAQVEGTVDYDPAHPEATKLDVTIQAASINTREANRDTHLKSPDFLDVEKFPHLKFVSKTASPRGDALEITGDLTIRDATREVKLLVEDITPERPDPYGKRRVGATARTKLRRSDFGMRWNAALEAGGVLVGDEVAVEIEVELIRQ